MAAQLGGDPHILGKVLALGGKSHTIIGVIGASFRPELSPEPDIYLPFQIDPASVEQAAYFKVVARLQPQVTLSAVNASLQAATKELHDKFPKTVGVKDRFAVVPLRDSIVSESRSSLITLSAAVACLLLIACANLANLTFVRAAGRLREIALRSALGASRARLIAHLLTESVALSLIGGAMGVIPSKR